MPQELNDLKIIDPRYRPDEWAHARKKRLFLAAYIDYLYVGVLWMYLQYMLGNFSLRIVTLANYGHWLIFAVYELLIFKVNLPSLGANFLSINEFKYQACDKYGKPVIGHVRLVRAWVKSNESLFSMIVALIFLSNGTKSIVRWMMWNPPIPLFGSEISESASIIVYLVMGVTEVFISYFLFKLDMRAIYIGFPYLIVSTVSALISWNLWDPFITEMVVRRRRYQGLPVRGQVVEFFQSIVPEILLIAFGLMIIALAVLFLRFKRIRKT